MWDPDETEESRKAYLKSPEYSHFGGGKMDVEKSVGQACREMTGADIWVNPSDEDIRRADAKTVKEIAMQTATPTIQDTLAERGKTHGDYSVHAEVTQRIKSAMDYGYQQSNKDRYSIPSWMQETVDMIAHKLGRIAAGDPDFKDHYHDIAGYATLAADRCSK